MIRTATNFMRAKLHIFSLVFAQTKAYLIPKETFLSELHKTANTVVFFPFYSYKRLISLLPAPFPLYLLRAVLKL